MFCHVIIAAWSPPRRAQEHRGLPEPRWSVCVFGTLAAAGAKGSMLHHAGEEDFNSLIGLLWTFKSLPVAKQHTCLIL